MAENLHPLHNPLENERPLVTSEMLIDLYSSIPDSNPHYLEALSRLATLKSDLEEFQLKEELEKAKASGDDRAIQKITEQLELSKEHSLERALDVAIKRLQKITEQLKLSKEHSPERELDFAIKRREQVVIDRVFNELCGYEGMELKYTNMNGDLHTLMTLSAAIKKLEKQCQQQSQAASEAAERRTGFFK